MLKKIMLSMLLIINFYGIWGQIYPSTNSRTIIGNEFLTLTVVPGNASNVLIWQVNDLEISNNTGTLISFIIEKKVETRTDWYIVANVNSNVLSWIDTGLNNGITYSYRISGVFTNPNRRSTRSNIVTGTPSNANIQQHREEIIENFSGGSSFGLVADPAGFFSYGPEAGFEITSRNMNYQFIAKLSSLGASNSYDGGVDIFMSINYLSDSSKNGFYFGGVGGYSSHKILDSWFHNGIFLGAGGYRFVYESGLNMRIGIGLGANFGSAGGSFIWRPVTSVGYSF